MPKRASRIKGQTLTLNEGQRVRDKSSKGKKAKGLQRKEVKRAIRRQKHLEPKEIACLRYAEGI